MQGGTQNHLGVALATGGEDLEVIWSQINKGVWVKGFYTQGHRTSSVDGPDLSGIGPDLSGIL
jgi:hypothetical protein